MELHKKRTIEHLANNHWWDRVNNKIAIVATRAVGTMWCAYIFAAFDCLALPTAISQGMYGIVQWVASFFLQLVLLSVIMVGQNLSAAASDARAVQTFQDAEEIKDLLNPKTPGGITVIIEKMDNAKPQ